MHVLARSSAINYSDAKTRLRALAVRSQPPPPDRLHSRNTQNYALDSPVISTIYKKRTNPRSHQLWSERAVERPLRPVRRRGRSTGPTRNARGYWAFERPAGAGETVSSSVNGGGLEPEIQRSLTCSDPLTFINTSHAAPRCATRNAGNTNRRRRPADPRFGCRYWGALQHERHRVCFHEEPKRQDKDG